MPKQQDIRTLVDQFVSDLSARVREAALETVRAALGDSAAPKRRGRGRPRKVGKRGPGRPPKTARRGPGRPRKAGRRARRSTADLAATAAKVQAYVRSNAGQRLEEIGQGLETATAELKRPIQVLLAAGKLRTEGQKRGTRYFAGARGGGKAKAGRKGGRKAAKRAKRKARRAPRGRRRAARKARRSATKRAGNPASRHSAKSRRKAPARRKITRKVRRVVRKIQKALKPKPSAAPSVPLLPEPGRFCRAPEVAVTEAVCMLGCAGVPAGGGHRRPMQVPA